MSGWPIFCSTGPSEISFALLWTPLNSSINPIICSFADESKQIMPSNKQTATSINLSVPSTAAIIYNSGFTGAHSSVVNLLNKFMIDHLEALCKQGKHLSERDLRKADLNPNLSEAMNVVEKFAFCGLEDLKEYIENVGMFMEDIERLPSFPVKKCKSKFDETLANFTMFTTMGQKSEEFPSYESYSMTDLGLQELLPEKRYATRSTINDTLDSLASPILEFRRPAPRKRKLNGPTNENMVHVEEKETNITEIKTKAANMGRLKSVHSIQGLKLRLMKNMENTPPGYFSARSMNKPKTEQCNSIEDSKRQVKKKG